jgi:hypothetical protein
MERAARETYLRKMAEHCRLLANEQLTDASAAESLRKLAVEYEEAANAHVAGVVRPDPHRLP